MKCNRIFFSGHALQRMFARSIRHDQVSKAVKAGEIIERYPDDQPFPSCLILGRDIERPIHVVVGIDEQTRTCYIVTVYVPDPGVWDSDFKTRRKP